MLVIIWAFAGIAIKHANVPMVAASAWIMTGLVGLMLIIGASLSRRQAHLLKPTG
jgi:hypothetical protein